MPGRARQPRHRRRTARLLSFGVTCVMLVVLSAGAVAARGQGPTDHGGMSPNVSGVAPRLVSANEQTAYTAFINRGLTDFQAAGIVGNLDQESGMDPTAVQAGGAGRGIAQWSVGMRWDTGPTLNVVGYANSFTPKRNPYSLSLQLDFIWAELNTYPYLGLADLKAATNVTDAVVAFQDNYERCDVDACRTSTRVGYAQAAFERYSGLTAPASVPAGSAVWTGSTGSTYHVFRTGTNGHLIHTYFLSRQWVQEDLGGVLVGTPSVVYSSGRYDLFAVNAQGTLYQKTYQGTWGPWRAIDLGFAPGVTAVLSGSVFHIFGHGPTGRLLHSYGTTSFTTQDLGGVTVGTPAVTYREGRYDVFSVSPNDGRLYQKTYASSWLPFRVVPGGTYFSGSTAGAAAVWTGTALHVFVRSPSSSIVDIYYTGNWSAAADLGGVVASAPGATYHDSRFDLFAPGSGGTLIQSYFLRPGGWTPWSRIA